MSDCGSSVETDLECDDYGQDEEYEYHSEISESSYAAAEGGSFSQPVSEMDLLKEEVKLLKQRGYNAGFMRFEVTLSVFASFSVAHLKPSLQRACGLDPNKSVVVQLLFNQTPPTYLSSCPNPKEIVVRQTRETNLDKGTLEDCEKFGLWWTLEQRLYEWLRERWAGLVALANEEMSRMSEINSVVSYQNMTDFLRNASELGITSIDERTAFYMLKQCNNNLDEARERYLVDDVERENAILQSSTEGFHKDSPHFHEFSPLLKILHFLTSYLENSTAHCIVCGSPHPLKLLKPVVCGEQLCNFQAIDLGLGVDLESEVLNYPNIVDFLVCSTFAGARSGKHFKCPWDHGLMSTVLNKCPGILKMQEHLRERGRKEAFREFLDQQHERLYKVLHWVVSTNRAHLTLLPESQHISELGTRYQFILNSTPPEEEQRFQRLKAECKGSFYAFHGSPLGNWHSILREGLKPKNYTTAYGSGIYMATNAQTSFNYMRQASGFPESRFGRNLRVMALCEVADHGSSKECRKTVHRPNCACNKSSPHYRIEAEEYCVTRFLFLWNEETTPQNCEASKLKDRLDKVLKSIRCN